MLKQIKCDLFREPLIIFNEGLNAIVGDNIASNSIGKSTMLMIIDFIFGGDDYVKKNRDVVDNMGHHSFYFSFIFEKTEYFYSRTTQEHKFVSICDKDFVEQKTIKLTEYMEFLQEKYHCIVNELSFRNIIGRYFRVYGKENLNEKKPIQYFEKERQKDSIIALIKLFNKYESITNLENRIEQLVEKKAVLVKAAKNEFVPNINQGMFRQNEKSIKELNLEITKLKENIVSATADIEALVSKEILELRRKKSNLIIQKNMLDSRLKRTVLNLKRKNIVVDSELERLSEYFPNFNTEQVKKIDQFHDTLTRILKEELQSTEREIEKQVKIITQELVLIDQEITDKLTIKNAPKYAIEKVVEIAAEINRLTEENAYYIRRKDIDVSLKSDNVELERLRESILDDICNQINIKLVELNKEIYIDNRRAPTFSIHKERYSFTTFGDTGTGTAFANLISFDIALLDLTCLPAIAHDLPLIKNIENSAMENIIELYSKRKKQIFIAIDKINTYNNETEKRIRDHMVLQLTNEKTLFTKNWKRENTK